MFSGSIKNRATPTKVPTEFPTESPVKSPTESPSKLPARLPTPSHSHSSAHFHFNPPNTTSHSPPHQPSPTNIGINLFSLVLTGAIQNTKNFPKKHCIAKDGSSFSIMHMNLGLKRISHSSSTPSSAAGQSSASSGPHGEPHSGPGGYAGHFGRHSTGGGSEKENHDNDKDECKYEKLHDKHEKSHSHHHGPNIKRFIPSFHKKADAEVIVEDISLKLVPVVGKHKFACLIRNLFTPEECASLIELSEREGYTEAKVTGRNGEEIMRKDIRNSGRAIIDDAELAELWFQRVMDVLENNIERPDLKEKFIHAPWASQRENGGDGTPYEVVGINERLRFLRYLPGQYFGLHQDAHFVRGPEFGDRAGEISQLTFLLYLNDKMKGGETQITNGSRSADVVPRTGTALIFDHDIFHLATKIESGVKFAVRTDVMYRKCEV